MKHLKCLLSGKPSRPISAIYGPFLLFLVRPRLVVSFHSSVVPFINIAIAIDRPTLTSTYLATWKTTAAYWAVSIVGNAVRVIYYLIILKKHSAISHKNLSTHIFIFLLAPNKKSSNFNGSPKLAPTKTEQKNTPIPPSNEIACFLYGRGSGYNGPL